MSSIIMCTWNFTVNVNVHYKNNQKIMNHVVGLLFSVPFEREVKDTMFSVQSESVFHFQWFSIMNHFVWLHNGHESVLFVLLKYYE